VHSSPTGHAPSAHAGEIRSPHAASVVVVVDDVDVVVLASIVDEVVVLVSIVVDEVVVVVGNPMS
jgi:hypothetical protein